MADKKRKISDSDKVLIGLDRRRRKTQKSRDAAKKSGKPLTALMRSSLILELEEAMLQNLRFSQKKKKKKFGRRKK